MRETLAEANVAGAKKMRKWVKGEIWEAVGEPGQKGPLGHQK